jgi:hypothetical protein
MNREEVNEKILRLNEQRLKEGKPSLPVEQAGELLPRQRILHTKALDNMDSNQTVN